MQDQTLSRSLTKIEQNCTLDNDILYFTPNNSKRRVFYLPETLREELILQVHEEMGHQEMYKMIKYIKDRFYWKGITRLVKTKIRSCHDCQLTKSGTVKTVGPCQSIVTKDIGELVMVDLYGPLPTGQFGMNYIFVVQDSFSKFVKFYALRKATASSVLGKMRKFFDIIMPKAIMSDNGSQFVSKLWVNNMTDAKIKLIRTTVANPRPNIVERVKRELGRLFRTYCRTNHKGWVTVLPRLEELYNNTFHETTKFTPCEIMYGQSTTLSFDKVISKDNSVDVAQIRQVAWENLKEASQKRQNKFNQRYRLIEFQIGDLVKINKLNKSDAKRKITKKFAPLYEGPYVVAAVPYHNVYVLIDPKTRKIRGKFNAIHLSRYYESKRGLGLVRDTR